MYLYLYLSFFNNKFRSYIKKNFKFQKFNIYKLLKNYYNLFK